MGVSWVTLARSTPESGDRIIDDVVIIWLIRPRGAGSSDEAAWRPRVSRATCGLLIELNAGD